MLSGLGIVRSLSLHEHGRQQFEVRTCQLHHHNQLSTLELNKHEKRGMYTFLTSAVPAAMRSACVTAVIPTLALALALAVPASVEEAFPFVCGRAGEVRAPSEVCCKAIICLLAASAQALAMAAWIDPACKSNFRPNSTKLTSAHDQLAINKETGRNAVTNLCESVP
jgi:hypothetical protein